MSNDLMIELNSLVDRITGMHSASPGLDSGARSELVWSFRKMQTNEERRWLHQKSIEFCNGKSPVKRQIGCDLLSMNNGRDLEQQEEAVETLQSLLGEPDGSVVAAAMHALRNNDAAKSTMQSHPELARHLSPEVRTAFAGAIGEGYPSPVVVQTMISLSRDENERVRDWATFEIGSIFEIDTLEIREALFDRVRDSDFETRSEALRGLAVRRDLWVLEPLIAELNAETVGRLAVEAAGDLAHPALVPSLESLLSWWDVDTELLQSSLTKCRQGAP